MRDGVGQAVQLWKRSLGRAEAQAAQGTPPIHLPHVQSTPNSPHLAFASTTLTPCPALPADWRHHLVPVPGDHQGQGSALPNVCRRAHRRAGTEGRRRRVQGCEEEGWGRRRRRVARLICCETSPCCEIDTTSAFCYPPSQAATLRRQPAAGGPLGSSERNPRQRLSPSHPHLASQQWSVQPPERRRRSPRPRRQIGRAHV